MRDAPLVTTNQFSGLAYQLATGYNSDRWTVLALFAEEYRAAAHPERGGWQQPLTNVVIAPTNRIIVAHELAHRFGRRHNLLCDAEVPAASLRPSDGTTGEVGWDVRLAGILAAGGADSSVITDRAGHPAGSRDLMTQCELPTGRWISPYTWFFLLDRLRSGVFIYEP